MFLLHITLVAVLLATGTPPLTDAQKASLARYFGFDTLQIYKIKPGIAHLRLADLDGDGRKDIIFWNGQQSRFEVFYQPQPGAAPPAATDLERNEVPNRGPLRNESIPVNYRVASHEVADVTGDGRPDIVFFGEPKELVVLPGIAQGGFGPVDSVRAPDGEPRGGCLATGDFNHDGKTDVALLGESILQLFLQKPDGGLGKPVRLVHGIPSPMLMLALDLNGDGRQDLVIGSDDDRYGVHVCLQTDAGTMAALRPIRVPRLRSMTVAPAAGRGDEGASRADALFGIEFATGRVQLYHWEVAPETGVAGDWPQYRYSYPVKSPSKRRPLALGDVDADGRVDVVTVDPDAGQLILFHGERGGLGPGTAYPALLKTNDVFIGDIDGDGRAEVVTASPQEKALGVSRWQEGRLTFPVEAPAQGEPLAVAFGRRATTDPAVFRAYVTRADDDYHLLVDAGDGTHEQKQTLDDVSDDPAGLRVLDLNQDGRNDLLLFVRFAAPQAFLQNEPGEFKVLRGAESRAAMLKEVDPSGAAQADVDGDGRPELLLAQGNIVRALRVKDGRWSVVDQYSAETADAQITGLAALPGTGGGPTLVMYERKARELIVQKRKADGTYGVVQSMPVGAFDITAMEPLPLGKDEGVGVLLADPDKVALLVPDQRAPTLVERQTYQSDAKDAWLADTAIGDVNHDGIPDVVVVDAGKAALEIVTTAPDGALVRALRFQVFQGKRFTDSPDMRGQLREVLVGDVTGDGHDDIVLLVHDRVIVYPAQ